MDKLDSKILYELEQDARQSLPQIAKKVRASQQVVNYRLHQFQKNGILGQTYTLINFAKLGYSSYRTMLRLGNIGDTKYREMINYFMNHKNVLWLAECGGKWDLIVNILAKNPIQYNSFLLEMKNKFEEIVLDSDLLLTIEGVYFGRNYLSEKSREMNRNPYFGREIKTEKIDKLDLEILSCLSQNAWLNSVNIGTKLKVTSNTIINRIKEMKKEEVILGFKPLIHLEKISYQGFKALIKTRALTEEQEKKMLSKINSNDNIVGFLRMIGSWNLEIEFEVQSREEMLKISREIREKFKEAIKEFEVIPLFHEYKYNFFPGDLLKN